MSSLAAFADRPFELLEELDRRCRAAALGRGADVAHREEWVGVGYRFAGMLVVTAREQVRELLHYPDSLTRIPGARKWLRGLANVRGNLLPVIDLAQFLGGEETVTGRSTRLVVVNHSEVPAGLIVDEVRGFRRFTADESIGTETAAGGMLAPFTSDAYRRGDEHWTVLDLHRLVESPVFLHASQ